MYLLQNMSGAFVVINCKSLSIKGMAIVNQIYVSNICTERERERKGGCSEQLHTS